jgi:hypothetical protein
MQAQGASVLFAAELAQGPEGVTEGHPPDAENKVNK